MKTTKTNAARLLDQQKIAYDLIPYEVDEEHLGAEHTAELLGEPIERIFKTLVLRGDKLGFFVCVIPGAEEVDLKKAAKVTGNKKVEMIHVKELLPLTGYISSSAWLRRTSSAPPTANWPTSSPSALPHPLPRSRKKTQHISSCPPLKKAAEKELFHHSR